LYFEECFIIVEAPSLVDMFSPLYICTSSLQSTNNRIHIGDMAACYNPRMWRFVNIRVLCSKLLYFEECFIIVQAPSLVDMFSSLSIRTS
jgi:hypothetical protein